MHVRQGVSSQDPVPQPIVLVHVVFGPATVLLISHPPPGEPYCTATAVHMITLSLCRQCQFLALPCSNSIKL